LATRSEAQMTSEQDLRIVARTLALYSLLAMPILVRDTGGPFHQQELDQ
jgi:hypothetical protein